MPYRVPSPPPRPRSPDVDERLFARTPFDGWRWSWFVFWAPWLILVVSFGTCRSGGERRPVSEAERLVVFGVVAVVSAATIAESLRRRRRRQEMVERLLRVEDEPAVRVAEPASDEAADEEGSRGGTQNRR